MKMEEKWIEIPLPNGYQIFIDNNGSEGVLVGLINPNGFTITDRKLPQEMVDLLKEVIS
jgi:hypothetical protein